MAQRGIREYHAKRMVARHLSSFLKADMPEGESTRPNSPKVGASLSDHGYLGEIVLVNAQTDWKGLARKNPWLNTGPLVAKPDQLFGKRGKHGLVLVNKNLDETKAWIDERMGKTVKVGETTGVLTDFLIEPCTKHDAEYYVAIKTLSDGDVIYFSTEGGINVEENWDKVVQIKVPVLGEVSSRAIEEALPKKLKDRQKIAAYIKGLHGFFAALHFSYLEINPFTIVGEAFIPLDMVAKVDDTAHFQCKDLWGEDLEFPASFGRVSTPEEEKVRELDSLSGASLKLTILNPEGRIWNMVAGGGASVIFADTVCDLGHSSELAFYGEYSGDPSTQLTYEYAKVVMDLMTRKPDPKGRPKCLIIGGGIANFTDVAKTFTGIIMALKDYAEKLRSVKAQIFVRRGGPNFHEGLAKIKKAAEDLKIPISVHGPEYHMTRIVADALALGTEK